MKTALDILLEFDDEKVNHHKTVWATDIVIQAMKLYANHDEAAEKVTFEIVETGIMREEVRIDVNSILSLKDPI